MYSSCKGMCLLQHKKPYHKSKIVHSILHRRKVTVPACLHHLIRDMPFNGLEDLHLHASLRRNAFYLFLFSDFCFLNCITYTCLHAYLDIISERITLQMSPTNQHFSRSSKVQASRYIYIAFLPESVEFIDFFCLYIGFYLNTGYFDSFVAQLKLKLHGRVSLDGCTRQYTF